MRRCSESGIFHQGYEVHDYRSRKRGVKVPYVHSPASGTSAVPHLHCLRAQRRAPYNNLVFFSAFRTPSTTPRGTVHGITISLRSSFQFSSTSSLCASNTCLVLPQPSAFASPTPTVGRLGTAHLRFRPLATHHTRFRRSSFLSRVLASSGSWPHFLKKYL